MPDFGTPFAGNACDRKLTVPELVRAIRFAIAGEMEAVQLYVQLAESTDDKLSAGLLRDIADEERVHVGELMRLVFELDPEEQKLYEKGMREAEDFAAGMPDA